ncbi:variable large family protein [Borrelia turicatae]|uniref:Variable large protein n=1 Tax=Borrelia turicatae (strain 91E135) TaxID=314724 RepID=A0ABF7R040_BORT9|nr:variable large family protein [Borrelia turicatae]ASJ27654.1 VlpD1 [Borrelia turicatae 91E135]ASJ27768.1 VlpD1 [Borrelia turicatae 91E135]ASJ27800.1 VlpD1 [Borrelia turicatae 91E135]UPA14266.1 variable large family protein [Borrelia turicatae 91E135]UPA14333.1 variable large family protein [Borrelia turicatae 91E135]
MYCFYLVLLLNNNFYFLFLLLSCGSGSAKVEDPKTTFLNSIANLGKGFLDVFTSFSDMVAGAFGIKADTKKSDIGQYFTDIEKTMTSVKKKLRDEVVTNGNYSKLKSVVDTFITNTLDKIAEGAKEAAKGATGDAAIGGATKDGQDPAPAEVASVNSLVKGIKDIVGVVLKKGEGDASATKTGNTEQKSIGKLLGKKDDGTEAHAAAASASIGAVTGADILQAIAKSDAVSDDPKIENAKNAADIAAAKADANGKDFGDGQKDAVIAAGIALRAMAKDGKFASKQNEDKSAHAVNGAAASAVGKTLSTLIIAIRNTVDSGLQTINAVLATVTQEDKSAEATTPADATASGQ